MGDRPVLLVGADGQVGRAFVRHGEAWSGRLVALGHRDLDIRDGARVRDAVKRLNPEVVINAAAYTAVDAAERDVGLAFAVNRDGVGHLAAACADASIPLIHVSTDYVFDGEKGEPYLETDPVHPLGVYGASKLAGEDLLRSRLEEHVILRTAWVFSPDRTNFVKTILRLASERPELRVVADQRGGPTSADAIARALVAITERILASPTGWGTYHFCGAPAVSWWDFASAIVDVAAPRIGRRVPIAAITTADYPTPARRPKNSVLSCARIAAVFGLAQPDWREALPRVVGTILDEGARA
ncbi:MAG: dTDP-4-dehydrorhamnose reductase [Alphaproteobacteria bacterium]